jgi:hypothetical protein
LSLSDLIRLRLVVAAIAGIELLALMRLSSPLVVRR